MINVAQKNFKWFNSLRYCIRHFTIVKDPTVNHEQWRTQVFNKLVSKYGHEHLIRKLFRQNPQFEKSDFNIWDDFMKTLFAKGFEVQDSFNILRKCPNVLGLPPEQLNMAVNKWGNIFPSSMLKFLILNNPEFLDLDEKCISKRSRYLLSYCSSKESLMTMLFLCPNLMYENWDEILKKIEFLTYDMVVHKTETFHCKALSKPLLHIKLRFSILEKCGLYIRPNPYLNKQTKTERLKLNNPMLKDITDKNNISFAKKIAKISLEEYNTYSDLFYQYENEYSDDESDTDEED